MNDKERIAKDLATVVGADSVVVDPDELKVYETDGLTIFKARPDIVVLPRSAEEVARIWETSRSLP
jgi:glycolate oxidase